MTTSEQAKAGLATIIMLYGVEGALMYQRLCDIHGPATVHRYLLELLEERGIPHGDARRI